MTTKPPSPVARFSADALEKIAYDIVADIPAQEPNDIYRLGYTVWMWLVDRKGTLEQAIRSAGSRTHVPVEEVVATVTQRLKDNGVEVS